MANHASQVGSLLKNGILHTAAPRIHAYTICWNVEGILPYFLRHYSGFCDQIVFYDNMSTDGTREIIRGCSKAVLVDFDTTGQIDEQHYLRIKNHAYKQSRGVADFVIVADIDEFLYHPRLGDVLTKYKTEGVTLPRVDGYNMVSLLHPRQNGDLIKLVKRGRYSPQYSKRCVFDPQLEINYLPGAHRCEPVGTVVESQDASLKLLHYHYLGCASVISRYRAYRERLSAANRRLPYAVQYKQTELHTCLRFLKNWLLAKRVI